VLVLDGFCITEVHLERISKPTETFLDEGWGHTSLVKEHTGPDTEGMGRIFLRSSNEVDGHTFFTASRMSVAILLPVMYSNGAFLVL
jgi:hypothetical protein